MISSALLYIINFHNCQAAGLFTVNEQQTREICNFCPKSYSGGRNSKNTGTHSIIKHLKSAHADIPQVAAAFDLVAQPKAVERRRAIQATVAETINAQEAWGFNEACSM